MIVLTFNNLIQLITNICVSHKQVRSFGHGEIWEINGDPKNAGEYAQVWLVPVSTTVKEQTIEYQVRILCHDLVQKSEGNEDEVLSDTLLILTDIVKILRYYSQDFTLLNEPSFTPYTERFADDVTGWSAELTIEVNFDSSDCDIPISDFVTPATNTSGSIAIMDFGKSGYSGYSGFSGIDGNSAIAYTQSFNATTDWTLNALDQLWYVDIEHNLNTYNLNFQVWDTTSANPSAVFVEAVEETSADVLRISVPVTPNGRFEGRVTINGSAASGVSGFSGVNGSNGSSGVSGFSGSIGVSGFSGSTGSTGSSGVSGFSGATGSNGSTGTSGFSGFSGSTGTSGFSGSTGTSYTDILVNQTVSGLRRQSKLSIQSANTINTAGRYLCWKVTPAKSFTCTALGCIHSGTAAGYPTYPPSFFRIGLYTGSPGSMKPGNLLEETGSLPATAGLKEGTINQYIDATSTYWIVIQVSSTLVNLPYMSQTINDIVDPTTGYAWCGATAVAAYGALPADFSAITLAYGRPANGYAYEVTMTVA